MTGDASRAILLMGGCGYLGGRLAEALETAGWTVFLGVRRPPERLPAWAEPSRVRFADLADAASLDRACTGIRAVVHLAALGAADCARDPARAHAVNVEGTRRLADACDRRGVARLLYFSTIHVYGAPLAGVIDRDTPPAPVHPYAVTHHAAAAVVRARGHGLWGEIRLSNAFGPPRDDLADAAHLVVNDLCAQAASGVLAIRGHGREPRNMIPMPMVGRAVAAALAAPDDAWSHEAWNLGGDWNPRMAEIAELVAERAAARWGRRPRITFGLPRPDADPPALDFRSNGPWSRDAARDAATRIGEIDATLARHDAAAR
ncbi:NAD(P)-dependent oxidoreductase [Oleispirillum naphthae]|uniref:NAD-dependent epimerase/dehydratase family protein n=1 Tax=Oleispirillum naphthae TaxID=2838853 RepID=UPI00308220AE